MSLHSSLFTQWHSFLNSALDGSEWSTPRTSHLTPEKQPRDLLNSRQFEPYSGSKRFWRTTTPSSLSRFESLSFSPLPFYAIAL